jgi:hypothetical protein
MLADGVIEECDSAYAAPTVLVPKKDGSLRVCVDYRKLNSVTVPDRYPLPRIDDLLQMAVKTVYMSSLDLKAGYWRVPVRAEDRDKTAFVTPLGLFRFTRMPFGLIDRFRAGLPAVKILAYLDDLIVISETFEKHLQHLTALFGRLELFRLRANRKKCCFARATLTYLGHILTPSGISRVSAICNRAPPTDVKGLLSWLQTARWFRRFVPSFADVVRPLTSLTRKNSVWVWGPEQTTAFETIKTLLTSPPILRNVDNSLPFPVKTDASAFAVGACLLQGEDKHERPIEFASRLLSPAEKSYSTTEREALAVVYALQKFRGYVEGSPIIVMSDHQPLRWLLTLKTPSGRLARWALWLQSFDLQVEYAPGRTNVLAHFVSRPLTSESAPNIEIGLDNCSSTTLSFVPLSRVWRSLSKTASTTLVGRSAGT